MVVIATSISARDLRSLASSSACFSLGPHGLIIDKPLTSASFDAFLMSLHTTLISLTSAKRFRAAIRSSRSTAASPAPSRKSLGERQKIGFRDPIGAVGRLLRGQMETSDAHERQETAAVANLRILHDATGAAERIELRRCIGRLFVRGRLNDADQPFAGERVVEHLEIARLEHRELDRPARQEKRAGQRK